MNRLFPDDEISLRAAWQAHLSADSGPTSALGPRIRDCHATEISRLNDDRKLPIPADQAGHRAPSRSTATFIRTLARKLTEEGPEAGDLRRSGATSRFWRVTEVRWHLECVASLAARRCRSRPDAPPLKKGVKPICDRAASLADRKFFEVAFKDHPYARQAKGTLESVPKIGVADLKGYVRGVIAKDTLNIAVVGDIDPEVLCKLLDMTFGGLPASSNLTPVADVVAAKPPQRIFIPLDVPQTFVTFGGPGVRRTEPDFMAASVVNHILGGGLTSRLFREVREKRGLAYFVSERLVWMDHSAVFVGDSGTRADRAGETVEEIESQVRHLAEKGPIQQELDDAKSYLKGSQILALNTTSKLARTLLRHQLDKLPIDYLEKHDAVVDAVTLEDAKRAAARLWGGGLLTVLVGRSPVP
ncbi:M16 family metallopeptidase [Bradyrhizobium sp. PMVTL-01]|uniref:M16 family metallopeptidase n=1 Tax=Bradyrhizobium sp. PMVTL-01 TaxID=3434999 RepID=UPI003F730379